MSRHITVTSELVKRSTETVDQAGINQRTFTLPGEVLTSDGFVRKSAEAIVPDSNELH